MRSFHLAGRSTVHAMNAMVATSHPLAALTAIEVLRAGGTAVDAAVAGCALLGVIEPQSTGIGGDCFALIQPRGEGKITAYNGSGRAPTAAKADWYLERKINSVPLTSAHAVSIPGVDRRLGDHPARSRQVRPRPAAAARDQGGGRGLCRRAPHRLRLEEPVREAEGWHQHAALSAAARQAACSPATCIHQPELGKTLRAIAKDGRDAFYKGAIAEDMVETLRGIGGLHTLEDFAEHTTEATTPIGTMYKGYDVWQCPPNGPGITMLVMLNILSRFDLTKFAPLSVERFHLEAEAARIAYMMREQHVGDPAHVDVDVAADAGQGIRRRVGRQDPAWTGMLDLPNVAPPMNPSTIYITVVDKDRNVCSFINSIAHSFGSAIVSNKTGVLLQNRAGGFRIQPGHPNCIAPRQAAAAHHHSEPDHQERPLADVVRRDGRPVSAGRPVPCDDQHPRLWLRRPGSDRYAARPALRGRLPARGRRAGRDRRRPEEARPQDHQRGRRRSAAGRAIWIDWDKGTLTGGSDPRKDGCALGY